MVMKKSIYRFGHCGDLHLGCRPRGIRQRKLDIFDSYINMCGDMVEAGVDSVLIAGDFFHTKLVDFETLYQAQQGLSLLKNCGVNVFAVTGNHDDVPEYQWLQYLENYLHEDNEQVDITLNKNVRLFRINWMSISRLKEVIDRLTTFLHISKDNSFNILMLHQAVEGYIYNDEKKSYISKDYLDDLRGHFSYVALGHIHSSYSVDNLAFNPGSIEYLSTTDWASPTGWFNVNVYDDLTFDYELVETRKRPHYNLKISSEVLTIDKICAIIEEYGVVARAMLLIEFNGMEELSPRFIKEVEQEIYNRYNPVFLKIRNHTVPRQLALIPSDKKVDIYEEVFDEDAPVAREVAQVSKEPDKVIEVVK